MTLDSTFDSARQPEHFDPAALRHDLLAKGLDGRHFHQELFNLR